MDQPESRRGINEPLSTSWVDCVWRVEENRASILPFRPSLRVSTCPVRKKTIVTAWTICFRIRFRMVGKSFQELSGSLRAREMVRIRTIWENLRRSS